MKTEKINYKDLDIDKENDSVSYNDKLHKYWSRDGQECISVTTLIHKFETFDEDFWSSYKALEKLVTEEEFRDVKDTLLTHKIFKKEHYEWFGIEEEEFIETKKLILDEWAQKREESCVRGSAFHKAQELLHLGGKTKELNDLGLNKNNFNTYTSNKIKLGDRGIYPELLLSRISDDKKLRLAGQADLVIIDNKDVYILDYKTSKKIDKKSFFDRKLKKSTKMKYPLNNLDDTNFWHYSLQLSTYAWMIQKIDPEFNIKLLMLIHYDHDGNTTTYECEYLKSDVERMLGYYKKQIEHDEFKESRKKILF